VIPVIVIDGPAGVGKGTLAKKLASHYQFHYLDSGAVYRALANLVLAEGLDVTDINGIEDAIPRLQLTFPSKFGFEAHSAGQNIDASIRTEECSSMASKIAAYPSVRTKLLALQRDFQSPPGLVADGRDLGTVVFPAADVKIFLDASPKERAERRYKQLIAQGISASFDHLLESICMRDERDRTRSTAPLAAAEDALVVDSTRLSIEAVVDLAIDYVNKQLNY
jgi:cytidylate kinase